MTTLKFSYKHKTIGDLLGLFDRRELNLNPGFQRKSVWNKTNRREFIRSIFQGYPIPSIFLYKRIENGGIFYDVLDGKQRLEAVLIYLGKIKRINNKPVQSFFAPVQIGPDDFAEYKWSEVKKKNLGPQLMGYEVQIVEIEGDITDIRNLFVKIK